MLPSCTTTETYPLNLEFLAPEILVKILSYLAPLDVVSVRKVCSRLYSISKDRDIWLCILAGYDYPLPSINRSRVPTMELEKFLLQADITKNIWIGQRTGKPSVYAITLSPLESFVGLAEQYFVTKYNSSEEISWRWYLLPDTVDPVFSHTIAQGPNVAGMLGWWGMVEPGTNTLHIVYGVREEERRQCFLIVQSVELGPQSTFKVEERLNITVDSKFILDALPGKKSHSECYFPIVGHGYLVILPETRPSPAIHIFCLNTGQVSCCPWQTQPSFAGLHLTHVSTYHLTPWHFIQTYQHKKFFIYRLSAVGNGLATTNETYTVMIPDSIANSVGSLDFFPKSADLIFILTQSSKESQSDYVCHLLKISLKSNPPDITLTPQLCRTLTLIPPSGAVPTFTIPRSGEGTVIVPAFHRFSLTTKVVFKGNHMPEIFCIRLSLDTMSDPECFKESITGTGSESVQSPSTPTQTVSAPEGLEAIKLPDVNLGLANEWGRKSMKWIQCSGILSSSRIVIKAWGSNGGRMFVVDFCRVIKLENDE